MPILEPAEPKLVDGGIARSETPGGAAVSRADAGISVRAHSLAVVERRLSLKSVGGYEPQIVEAGADVMVRLGNPVHAAERQIRVGGTVQHAKVTVDQKVPRGDALRGGSGAVRHCHKSSGAIE